MSTTPTEPTPVPAELVAQVRAYVNAPDNRREFVETCTGEALELLEHRVGSVGIPPRVWTRAVKELAAELFHRQQSVGGVMTFDNGPEAPLETVRVTADPMRRVIPLLAPYLGPVIA